MIQRIQTLYLLMLVASLVAAIFMPWGNFFTADAVYSYEAFAVKSTVGRADSIAFWALGVILAVCALSAFVSIFYFKQRLTQVRFCIFNLIALIGFYIVFVIALFITKAQLQASFGLNFGFALPLVGMILDFLAMNAILKDEKKVRAYQRIR
ncbi:MAG: DUF4293 domain-containing protein [Bacteroidales bacterium]|nr:DUF4293 domain-containing protein [Bacteroidales bacterium]